MRNYAIAFIVLLITACGGGGSDSIELSNNACSEIGLGTKNLKIINGQACSDLARSPVVRLVMYDNSNTPLGYCSGTLIQANAVLTAAHCAVKGTIAAGVFYGDANNPKFVSVASIRQHPAYVPITQSLGTLAAFNDVAVYILKQNINLPVLPIDSSKAVVSGDVIDIFGYGTDENGDFSFDDLKSGQMLVDSVTENHISTFFNGDGSNTCQGDSGGPAIIQINGQSALVGITSTGTARNCKEGDNSLFTNLQNPSILDFISGIAPGVGKI